MIRIAIAVEAYEAIVATLPMGSSRRAAAKRDARALGSRQSGATSSAPCTSPARATAMQSCGSSNWKDGGLFSPDGRGGPLAGFCVSQGARELGSEARDHLLVPGVVEGPYRSWPPLRPLRRPQAFQLHQGRQTLLSPVLAHNASERSSIADRRVARRETFRRSFFTADSTEAGAIRAPAERVSGSYRLDGLMARLGADIAPPDLLIARGARI